MLVAVVTDNAGKVLNVINHAKGARDAANVDQLELVAPPAAPRSGSASPCAGM